MLNSRFETQWIAGNNGTVDGFAFRSPHSIAYDARHRRVWVADRENNRTDALSAQGQNESSYSSCFAPGTAWSVRVDNNRNLMFVADAHVGGGQPTQVGDVPRSRASWGVVMVLPCESTPQHL
jgi:DNA-binding beta-propeller fold protein YncE